METFSALLAICAGNSPVPGELFPTQRPVTRSFDVYFDLRPNRGAVTCAVCPESAWLVTFLIGNVSTGVVTWSALRCGASGESGKKVAAAPLSKTAAAAAAAKTWFAKHPLDYMLHNRFPWKRSGRRSSMWPPYSLRRNLSAAACRPCDRSLRVRSHVRFVRNPHGLLHFWLVTFQQEWSHGVHCGAVRPANQAKKLPQPRCQKLPQRPLRLKRDSPNTR